jgi:hypothetical protein
MLLANKVKRGKTKGHYLTGGPVSGYSSRIRICNLPVTSQLTTKIPVG